MRRSVEPNIEPSEVLQRNALFSQVSDAEREAVLRQSSVQSYGRGESIWQRGAGVDFVGLIGSGFVKMIRTHASGVEVTYEIMGPGQLFGLMGVLDGKGCPLSAVAVGSVELIQIPKVAMALVVQSSDAAREFALARAIGRMRDAQQMAATMFTGRADQRIAAVILHLSEAFGTRVGDVTRIDVPLSKQEIGEMAGTTTETTIRVMSKWQKLGLIRSGSRSVAIVDADGLRVLANGSTPLQIS